MKGVINALKYVLSFSQESTKERPGTFRMGSDGSAAGGGRSDLSEWQRSAENEPAASGEVFAGYRNRTPGLSRRPKGLTVPLESPKHFAVG